MKTLTLTLFLALICSLGFAQNATNLYTAKIDSVQNLLNKNPKDDTIKVRQLNDLALLCTFDMQFARGILAAKQARQLSQKLHYLKGEGLYLDFMGITSGGLAVYYGYKKYLIYANIEEKEESNKMMAFIPQKRDLEKVIVKLLEALKYFEKENEKEMMAHILAAISSNYQMLNKTSETIQYADRAIKLFKETGQPNLATLISVNKIIQFRLSKKINEANEAEKKLKSFLTNITDIREKALLYLVIGQKYNSGLNYSAVGFEYLLKADYELEKIGETDLRILVLYMLGNNFEAVGLHQKSFDSFQKSIELQIESHKTDYVAENYNSAVFELITLKKWDDAKLYLEKAKSFTDKIPNEQLLEVAKAKYHDASGQLLMGQGNYQEALDEFFEVNKMIMDSPHLVWMSMYMNSYIAQCYHKLGDLKKSISYGEKGYQDALSLGPKMRIINSDLLAEVYEETGQTSMAFEYLKKYRFHLKEKEEQDINNFSTNLAIENITQKNEQEKAALEKEKLMQRWWLFTIAAAFLSSIVFLYFLYRTNQNKQKANKILSRQKEEIDLQRAKAEETLSNLKSTQAQLIQSEKMASLGELTAGIAHEIQNPLNFVNNFSEVSKELAEELKEEANKENFDKGLIAEIATDIAENQKKIHHHGNRASSIVKGMLEHSRTSSGKKELTNINALADEYLRLAYHGLRAKDKDFNPAFETDFDPNLPKIEVIPQDIGRVLLNLINNAFQACIERSSDASTETGRTAVKNQGEKVYKPLVAITTQLVTNNQSPITNNQSPITNNKLQITITDNGPGIPATIKDKIFQPFFTTKPTGQGTGLGLSLAYDIVTKGHGGTIECESKEGEGSEFIITLPIKIS